MRTLAVIAALVAAPSAFAEAPKPTEKVKKRLGESVVGLLDGATKVEVFRVESVTDDKKPEKSLLGYRVLATGKDQDEKFAANVAAVVLNEKTYEWDSAKGCIFRPGVAFRVWKGDESVVVVICFSCDQIEVATLGKDGKVGKKAFADVDPGRAKLVRLAKAALPDDKDIQGLKEKR